MKEEPIVLNEEVKQVFSSKDTFETKLKELSEAARLGEEDRTKEKVLCKMLEEAFSSDFPNCVAYPFGSRMTGLGFQDSDLDVFLDLRK